MMYVIGRLAPECPSGCVYWNGRIRPYEGAGGQDYAETAAREGVWIATSREVAEAQALWLNTSPVAVGIQGTALWQAMPIPAEFGRVARLDHAARLMCARGMIGSVVDLPALGMGDLAEAFALVEAHDGRVSTREIALAVLDQVAPEDDDWLAIILAVALHNPNRVREVLDGRL